MALANLVIGHLHASAQLGQNHYLDVFVLQPYGQVLAVRLLVGNLLDDGVGIDDAARTLIDALLQEHRVLLGFAHLVGGNRDDFTPSFCFHCYSLFR